MSRSGVPKRKPPTRVRSAKSSAAVFSSRRSPCPVSCALDLFGDRWTLLVIRDLMLGRTRFKEFASSPEGIPTNILADRLERLLEGGVVRQVPAAEGARRMGYELTAKGLALWPIMRSLRDWGLKWEPGTSVGLDAK